MADIKVNNILTLNISGIDLFDDSENFLMELSTEDEANILGGVRCEGGGGTGCYGGSGWCKSEFAPSGRD